MSERVERLVRDIKRAGAEVVSFDDFSELLLPLLDRLFQTRATLLYRSDPDCPIVPLNHGDLARLSPAYVEHYLGDDPLQAAAGRTNPWIFATNRTPEWAQYLRGPAHEYWVRADVLYFLHGRLLEGDHYSPGMVGYVLTRAPGQPEFSADDELLAARLAPALQAAARRSARTLTCGQAQATLEGLIEGCGRPPTIAADVRGRLLWASATATAWLGGLPDAALPEALGAAVQRIVLAPDPDAGAAVDLVAPGGGRLRGRLRVCRPAGGEPFIAIELERSGPGRGSDPAVARVAERHGLTSAETGVLAAIARGARDREIAAGAGTSLSTVRTHVTRLLGKLGVRTRTEAALLARGAVVGGHLVGRGSSRS